MKDKDILGGAFPLGIGLSDGLILFINSASNVVNRTTNLDVEFKTDTSKERKEKPVFVLFNLYNGVSILDGDLLNSALLI